MVHYGDEQGFTGTGGDQLARQTMFASRVPEYLDDDLLGTSSTHARRTTSISTTSCISALDNWPTSPRRIRRCATAHTKIVTEATKQASTPSPGWIVASSVNTWWR